MSPQARRFVITAGVLGLAAGVVLVSILGPSPQPPTQPDPAPVETTPAETPAAATETTETDTTAAPPAAVRDYDKLYAEWVPITADPATLGSLDPAQAKLWLELSPVGAGLSRITLSDIWLTARTSRQARAHHAAVARGDANPPPLPDDEWRYVLGEQESRWTTDSNGAAVEVPVAQLAAHAVEINGTMVLLSKYLEQGDTRWAQWNETARGVFEATVKDGENTVARITRRFELGAAYDLKLVQVFENLTDEPMRVRWIQYGPGDLIPDRARYIDMRRFRFGIQVDPANNPALITSPDSGDLILSRRDMDKRGEKAAAAINAGDPTRAQQLRSIWPEEEATQRGYGLSWFSATNRYFAFAVHPDLDVQGSQAIGDLSLADVVEEIRLDRQAGQGDDESVIFTGLYSPIRTVEAKQATRFNLGVYAGPLERRRLRDDQPMAALSMQALILYQMSAFCAICTFQWLAILLLQFLSLVDGVVFDWGIAIILLVGVVRLILHPLNKRVQVNMTRFTKVMGEIKPEIDKLQKKYPNDPKRLQAEQLKMMREKGVNPLQMLGCLPMFLQMPIWIALYAMLYFAFELRQEPAFWGIFQMIGGWPFLADLSSADHAFGEFQQPFRFLLWNVTGINILPILMGVVFFIQQKYMSPPPSATMSPEQIQSQKIMKVMFVVMFPVMLYSAPSGLTLYIFTSSLIGIMESKYIRAHIKAIDLQPPKKPAAAAKGKGKGKKPKDMQARMYQSAIERAKEKRKGPPKKYKRRK